jgi:hypothetical protein
MKQLFLLSLISLSVSAQPIRLHLKSKPENPQSAAQAAIDDDDLDGQIVLANVANMLGTIGMISTDPHNPAVLGPGLAQIGISFINIVTQMFKAYGFDEEMTRARVEVWFMNLPDETKLEIISLLLDYAHQIRALRDHNYSIAP